MTLPGTTLNQLIAVVSVEARMQLRRRSLWLLSAAVVTLSFVGGGPRAAYHLPQSTPVAEVMGTWALTFNLLLPIAAGCLLADRLIRDRRLGVEELLATTATRPDVRLWGKYAGVVGAAAVPVLLVDLAAGLYETAHRDAPAAVPLALAAFATVNLPGLAFIAAFAMVCPLVLGAPLFRVLFVGYWFWGNLMNPQYLPSLTGSLLAPIGDYAAVGWFGVSGFWAGTGGPEWLRPDPTAGTAAASIATLLIVAALAVLGGRALLARRAAT